MADVEAAFTMRVTISIQPSASVCNFTMAAL
jgi:hypothetical protein